MWKSIFATVTISLGVASVFTLATEQHHRQPINEVPKTTEAARDFGKYQKSVRLIPIPTQPQQPDWYAATKYPINTNEDAPPLPEADKPVDIPPPPVQEMKVEHRVEKTESDICTRHGMHKVYYGKRWRCR